MALLSKVKNQCEKDEYAKFTVEVYLPSPKACKLQETIIQETINIIVNENGLVEVGFLSLLTILAFRFVLR